MEDFLVGFIAGLMMGVGITLVALVGLGALMLNSDREVCMQLTGADQCESRMMPVDLTTPERKAK